MWPAFYASVFIALATPMVLVTFYRDQAPQESPTRALAPSMLQHHQAARAYAVANPTFTGAIATSALSFPSWHRSPGYWQSIVSADGIVATYAASGITSADVGAFVDGLVHASAGSVGVGRSSNGSVQSVAGGVMPLPTGVPNGVPVAATKVR